MKNVSVISYGNDRRNAEIVIKNDIGEGKSISETRHVCHIGNGIYKDKDGYTYNL